MIKLNKDSNSPKMERASAPGIKVKKYNIKGIITIEAALAIPLFLFAVICLIYLIEVRNIRLVLHNASQSAAKETVEDLAVLPVFNSVKMQQEIIKNIGEERLERSLLDGGTSAISCWKSYYDMVHGEVNICVEYKVKLPIPLPGNYSAKYAENIKMSAWNGYQDGEDTEGEDELVYITELGTVWHRSATCPYLQLSIQYVPYTGLGNMRNESGGRYHACERCVIGTTMTGIYVTQYGDRYHNSLNCSGLKRTIRTIKKSQTAGKRGCSKCASE